MEIVYILIGMNLLMLILLAAKVKMNEKSSDKIMDVIAGWMSGTSKQLAEFRDISGKYADLKEATNELERRLHCVEEDLEKIPVEEFIEENKRLEKFNDGLEGIMSYGFNLPKLNKEGLKHE